MTSRDAGLIKKALLVPFGCSLGLLVALSFAAVLWLHQATNREHVRDHLQLVERLFAGELAGESRQLNTLIDFYARDETLQKHLRAQDREQLLAAVLPVFQEIRAKDEITHFYFINPDRTCFLRVHEPLRHGDYINRYTMEQAAHTGLPVHGVELGPLGTFTLRVVQPWKVGNEVIGYLELGREIEHIVPQLKNLLGLEILFFIDKAFLQRDKWEAGLTMLGRGHSGDWDRFPRVVLASSTLPGIAGDVGSLVNRYVQDHANRQLNCELAGRGYDGGFVPLLDAGGNEVGAILALHDVTNATAQRTIMLSIMALTLLAGGILFIMLQRYTGRLQDRLITLFADLDEEIEERCEIAAALQAHKENLEAEVAGRTVELAQTNEQLKDSLHEKETLLKEIHHRVKNNMQVISSLLKLQARKISNQEFIDILEESQNRVRVMALIHEKLYRSDDLAKIQLAGYVSDLSATLHSLYGADASPISFHIDVGAGDTFLDIDTAIPFGLIINELVTNALKYAFPHGKGGKISVQFRATEQNECRLIVADNGIGLPEDMDFRKTDSLGLHLVTMLVEDQLDGAISLDRSSGTRFEINFRRRHHDQGPHSGG